MTAPVVMEQEKATKGTPIAMTAPVAMENDGDNNKRMKFFLPAEYDDMSKIPQPTNPVVKIQEVPPAVGAIHRYSGSMSETTNQKMALALAAQLRGDGIQRYSDDEAKRQYQFWGYNPPFCLPMFRRNEVWLDLTNEEAQLLQDNFKTDAA
jgi:hypothetical protein